MINNVSKYIEKFFQGDKDDSLKKMKHLVNKLGNPEKDFKIIHVAGTTGKGSTVEMISNILIKQGYIVGKLISPHLIDFNERISVNNILISDEELLEIFNQNSRYIEETENEVGKKVTFKEMCLLTGLTYFKNKKCDFVVIEVGLGGKYDPTNIVSPIASVITKIGYDHEHVLGNTLEKIAEHKAGIIKNNSNTVFVEQEDCVNEIIINKCNKLNNNFKLIDFNRCINIEYNDIYQKFNYKNYKNIEINLKGVNQIKNALLAIETTEILKKLNVVIDEKAVREGLKTVIHRGRFEIINKNPLMIYDGAHNEDALDNFINTVDIYYSKRKRIYVLLVLKRKNYKKMLNKILKDKEAIFIFHDDSKEKVNKRFEYADCDEMFKIAKEIDSNIECYKMPLRESITFIENNYRDTVTFFIGSLYPYDNVIRYIKDIKNNK